VVLVCHDFYYNFLLFCHKIGKTCLLIRFNDETFITGNFISTVGIDYRNKIVTLGDKKITLKIFDTVC